MTSRSFRLLFLAVASLACAPGEDPVSTELPPRDPEGAALRRVVVTAERIDAATFVDREDFTASDRVLTGSWEGLSAIALLHFDFEPDTLQNATVTNAELLYNAPRGQGDSLDIALTVHGVNEPWDEDALDWPGPDLIGGAVTTVIDDALGDDSFPERSLAVPDSVIEGWLSGSIVNNGLAVTGFGSGAMLQIASSENNFAFTDSSGLVSSVNGPRLRFSALRPGDTDPISVFLGPSALTADAYVVSPDSAQLPSDPEDCLVVGRGVTHRIILRAGLPALPTGTNIHRAIVRFHVLGHPRFDRNLDLFVHRLVSEWPAGAPIDSLIETSGTIWDSAEADTADAVLEVPATGLVQAWYDGVYENRGLLIRATSEDLDVTAATLAGVAHPDSLLRPELELVYTEPYGGRP